MHFIIFGATVKVGRRLGGGNFGVVIQILLNLRITTG